MGQGREFSLILLVLFFTTPSQTQALCGDATSCCTCVATPGCSWFYNATLPSPFCAETPYHENPVDPSLEARTPYSVVKRVVQPRGRCKPINWSRGRLITPQGLQVKQNVGIRQEVQFEVMGRSRTLRLRVIDDGNAAVNFSVVPTFSNTCPRSFTLQRATTRRGQRLSVTCIRGAPGETSKFKLQLDLLACYSGVKSLRVVVIEPGSTKRLRVSVEANCACPCQSTPSSPSQDSNDDNDNEDDNDSSNEAARPESEQSASPLVGTGNSRTSCEQDCSGVAGLPSAESCENDRCHTGPGAPICSDRGTCLCGECVCGSPLAAPSNRIRSRIHTRPATRPSGAHCECLDTSCPTSSGMICGGPERGVCACNSCVCRQQYAGEACELIMGDTNCRPPGDYSSLHCSGHGECIQGQVCQCEPPYTGTYCQECPQCASPCQLYRECVECYLFGINDLNRTPEECARCQSDPGVRYHVTGAVRDTETLCVQQNQDGCQFQYNYRQRRSGEVIVYVSRHIVCPEPSGRRHPGRPRRRRP